MIELRGADTLGETHFNGVHAIHHFCFGPYQSPERLGWGRLRTLNRLFFEPRGRREPYFLGGMEVLLIAEDGNAVVTCGDKHVEIAAGNLMHLAMNAGADFGIKNLAAEPARLIEIWLKMDRWQGLPRTGRSRWIGDRTTVASDNAEDDPLALLDVPGKVIVSQIDKDESQLHTLRTVNRAYISGLEGGIRIGNQNLKVNDAIALEGQQEVVINGNASSNYLIIEC